ncbi:MAG: portal protein [Methylococcaceae bacterium]
MANKAIKENESEGEDENSDEDILEDAKELFERAAEVEADNRREGLEDKRFARLGEQWDDSVKRQREIDGRPCLTINKLPAYIRQVVNDSRQNKPSIRCHPVDSNSDTDTAEILNGLIRNIEYTSNADIAYDTALEDAVTMGFGYWRVSIDYAYDDTFDMDLCIERIANPFSIYGDPDSDCADSSDWNCAFVTELITKDEFESRWKDKDAVNWEGYEQLSEPWIDGEKVLICEYWKREESTREIVQLSDGSVLDLDEYKKHQEVFDMMQVTIINQRETKSHKVTQYILTGAEVLETKEWAGRYIPIVPVYGDEVNVEGKRYFRSLIRDAKDSQRQFNFWRTNATEMMALAPRTPWVGKKGAFNSDIEKWNTANTKNHPFIEYDGIEPPMRQAFPQPPVGMIQEAMNANDDIKAIIGIFDAGMGAQGNETSGKAILARQRESDTSTFHFIDNLSRAIRHTGRILVDLIPSVYNNQRVIRILGEDKKPTNVPLGQPTQTPKGVEKIYDLTIGKYDVTVECGASYSTKREEAAEQMLELIRVMPQAAGLISDLLVKNLDWAGSEEISERLAMMLPPEVKGQNPQMQAMQQQYNQQIQMLQAQLSQASQQLQQLQLDHMIDAEKLKIDGFKAETDRLKIMQPAMPPEQIQALVLQTVQQVMNSPDVFNAQPIVPAVQPYQPPPPVNMNPPVR